MFEQWFLAELIRALQQLELTETHSVEAVASTPNAQTVTGRGENRTLAKQSNLVPRPRQTLTTTVVDGTEYLLGDGSRVVGRRRGAQGMVPPLGAPHSIPCPPMPLVSPACGVRIAEPAVPPLPSFPYRLADDHYLDAGYEREHFGDGTVLCGNPTSHKPVELTGLYVQPDRDPCSLETRVRLDHIAYRRRPSIRMPYMAGLDPDGRYLRVVVIPMKSCRQYTPAPPT